MEIKNRKNKYKTNDFQDNKKSPDKLPEKVFIARNSLLTDLFENKHIETIYHVFGAILVGLFFNTIFYDYLKHQRLHFGFRLIIKGFGNFHWAFILWLFLLAIVCSTYVCFGIWANIHLKLTAKYLVLKLWDRAWIVILVIYYFYSYYWMLMQVRIYKLPPCSACCVVTEYTRLIMKVHAFVRENCPKVLRHNHHRDHPSPVPRFSKFSYFLFAPTLVYRDEYPRTKGIRWKFVAERFAELIIGVLFLSFTTERYLVPIFEDFCLKTYLWTDIFLAMMANGVAGIFFMLLVFYIVLHSTQNAFAEMLRFGDRLFYTDWWTSTTFTRYYRTWNIVIYDWLYTYIYKDIYEIISSNNRAAAAMTVFFVSSFVHEIMLTVILGVFCPIMFLEFFSWGVLLHFLKSPRNMASNIFLWWSIASGAGIQLSCYCIEFYARYNFPMENKTIWDFFVPRSLICGCIK